MAHCPYDRLADLGDILAVIRGLADLAEPRPGIFYLRRMSFLHFHYKDERRWADVRDGADWGAEVDIPFGAGPDAKRRFLQTVSRRYAATRAALMPRAGASRASSSHRRVR
jgi:hypothetical protein